MKKSLPQITFTIIIAIGYLFSTISGVTHANNQLQESTSPAGDCFGLDVVFLVDQSSSMSGGSNGLASDPQEQRKYAVEAAVNQLTDIALDSCPDVVHRVAVVSFGSTVRTDVEFTTIDPENLDDSLWIRENISSKLMADSMNATDPKLAFEEAEELLTQLPPSTGDRKRAIIFITDGVPYLSDWPIGGNDQWEKYLYGMRDYIQEAFPFDPTLLARENCFNALRERYLDLKDAPVEDVNACIDGNALAPGAYQNSTYFYVLTFKSSTPYPRQMITTLDELAQQRGGALIDLTESKTKDISSKIRDVLSRLSGVRASLVTCGAFPVNPYIKTAKLNIFKNEPENLVTLSYTDAAGNLHEIQGGVEITGQNGFTLDEPYKEYGVNERYVFNAPYPGLWELSADNCDGLDAYYEAVQFQSGVSQMGLPAEIATYDRPPYYDEAKPVYLTYAMRDTAGNVIPQVDHPFFAVDVDLDVTDPTGNVISYPMKWDAANTQFVSDQPLQIPVPGLYQIDIVGVVKVHEGEPKISGGTSLNEVFNSTRELFRHDNLEFTTFPVEIFTFEIIEPEDGKIFRPIHGTILDDWPLPVYALPVRVRVNLPEGAALEDVLVNQGTPFTAELIAVETKVVAGEATRTEVTRSITLQPDPAHPGEYIGEVGDLDIEGSYTWIVQMDKDSFDVHYRPDVYQKISNFTREDGLFNREIFYYVLLGIIIAIIIGLIIYNILIRTDKIAGTLVFESLMGGVSIAEFSLNSGKNWIVIPSSRLGYPELDLSRIRARYASPRRKKRAQDVDQEVGFDLNNGVEARPVRVNLTLHNRQTITRDLNPDIAEAYSDEAAAQIVYKPPQSV